MNAITTAVAYMLTVYGLVWLVGLAKKGLGLA